MREEIIRRLEEKFPGSKFGLVLEVEKYSGKMRYVLTKDQYESQYGYFVDTVNDNITQGRYTSEEFINIFVNSIKQINVLGN